MDIAYSEQAAVLLKGSLLSESRRLKDGNALTVSNEGIFPVRSYWSLLVERGTRDFIQSCMISFWKCPLCMWLQCFYIR